jgi:hypothetical protein
MAAFTVGEAQIRTDYDLQRLAESDPAPANSGGR